MTIKSDIEAMLARSLDDHRLSGSERRLLLENLSEVDAQSLAYYRDRAFDLAAGAMADPTSAKVLDWLEDVIKVLVPREEEPARSVDSEACFSPGEACRHKIKLLFEQTQRSADVCVFTITDDVVANAILRAHERRVAVRIVTDNEKSEDLGSDIGRLRDAGVAVRIDRSPYHMHHKFAIFDGRRLLSGSYNWTRGAAECNEENLIVTNDARLVTSFQRVFESLWSALSEGAR